MIVSTALTLLYTAAVAVAGPAHDHTLLSRAPAQRTICGTKITKEQILVAEASFHQLKVPPPVEANFRAKPIDVYWNAIYANKTLEGGYLPKKQVTDSIDVLNKDFAGALTFRLAGVKYHENATWFTAVGPDPPESVYQDDMKKKLRVGGAATLNVYSVGFEVGTGQGLLGYATFPEWYKETPWDDGVVIQYSSVPGGTFVPYDLGRTLTHEVGHWVGLYHTFEACAGETCTDDGCTGDGDFVDDTPFEKLPAFGCPVGRDTCPSEGVDPIENFMDYTDDACMTEFSRGQVTRAKAQMRTFRNFKC